MKKVFIILSLISSLYAFSWGGYWPTDGDIRVTNNYGVNENNIFHEGIDIFGVANETKCCAVARMMVYKVGSDIITFNGIDNSGDLTGVNYYYKHVNIGIVATGDIFESGDIINATIADPNNYPTLDRTSHPHIHFGIVNTSGEQVFYNPLTHGELSTTDPRGNSPKVGPFYMKNINVTPNTYFPYYNSSGYAFPVVFGKVKPICQIYDDMGATNSYLDYNNNIVTCEPTTKYDNDAWPNPGYRYQGVVAAPYKVEYSIYDAFNKEVLKYKFQFKDMVRDDELMKVLYCQDKVTYDITQNKLCFDLSNLGTNKLTGGEYEKRYWNTKLIRDGKWNGKDAINNTEAMYPDGRYKIKVTATDIAGKNKYEYADVIIDNFTTPSFEAVAWKSKNYVFLRFSENIVKTRAEDKTNYSLTDASSGNTVQIGEALLYDDSSFPYTVYLRTPNMANINYKIEVNPSTADNKVVDEAGNIVANKTILFQGTTREGLIKNVENKINNGTKGVVDDNDFIADPGEMLNLAMGFTNLSGQTLNNVQGTLVLVNNGTTCGFKSFGNIDFGRTKYNSTSTGTIDPYNFTLPEDINQDVHLQLQATGTCQDLTSYAENIDVYLPLGRKIIEIYESDQVDIVDKSIPGAIPSVYEGNYSIDPNEEIYLYFALKNIDKNYDASEVEAKLYVNSPNDAIQNNVEVISDYSSYGTILKNQVKHNLAKFIIRTTSSLPLNPVIPFILSIRSKVDGKEYYEERLFTYERITTPQSNNLPATFVGKYSPNGDDYKEKLPLAITFIGADLFSPDGYRNFQNSENLRLIEPCGSHNGNEYYFHFEKNYTDNQSDIVYIDGCAPQEVQWGSDLEENSIPDGFITFEIVEWGAWKHPWEYNELKGYWTPDETAWQWRERYYSYCPGWRAYTPGNITVKIDRVTPAINNLTIDKNAISSLQSARITAAVSESVNVWTKLIDPVTNDSIYGVAKGVFPGGQIAFDWDVKRAAPGSIPTNKYLLNVCIDDGANKPVNSPSINIIIDNTPPLITDLCAEPVFFTPDNDGVNDFIKVSCNLFDEFGEPITVRATITDSLDNVLPSCSFVVPDQVTGTFEFIWNGMKDGIAYPEGRYAIILEAEDEVGNVSADTVYAIIDLTSPTCSQSRVGFPAFSPNDDTYNDQAIIITELSDNSYGYCGKISELYGYNGFNNVIAEIKYQSGNLVKSLNPNSSLDYPIDPFPFKHAWDGNDEDGNPVDEGTYDFNISFSDMAGNPPTTWNGPLVLDITAPAFDLTSIIPQDNDLSDPIAVIPANGNQVCITSNQSLKFGYDLTDNLAGCDSIQMQLTGANGTIPLKMKWPEGVNAPYVWNGTDNCDVDIAEGIYSFNITAWDRAGNKGNSFTSSSNGVSEILIDRTGPFASVQAIPGVLTDGAEVQLTYKVRELMSDPVTISVSVVCMGDPSISYPVLVSNQIVTTGGILQEFQVQWDGDGLPMPDGRYVFTVEARDNLNNVTIATASVVKNRTAPQITSPNQPVGSGSVVCIRGIASDPDLTNQNAFQEYRVYYRKGVINDPTKVKSLSDWVPIAVPVVNQAVSDPLYPNSNISIRPQPFEGVLANWQAPVVTVATDYTLLVIAREKVTGLELSCTKIVKVDPSAVVTKPDLSVQLLKTDGYDWAWNTLDPTIDEYDTVVVSCGLSVVDALVKVTIHEAVPTGEGFIPGQAIYGLPAQQVQAGQTALFMWDGKNYRNSWANDGSYLLVAEAFANDGIGYTSVNREVEVNTKLEIADVAVNPSSFDPLNLSGVHQATCSYVLSKEADIVVEIWDAIKLIKVKDLWTGHLQGGESLVHSVTWNGDNNIGGNVIDRGYYFKINAINGYDQASVECPVAVTADVNATDLIASLNDLNIEDGVSDYTYKAFGLGARAEFNPRGYSYSLSALGRQRVKEYINVSFSVGYRKWHDILRFWVHYERGAHIENGTITGWHDQGWHWFKYGQSPVLSYTRSNNGQSISWLRNPSYTPHDWADYDGDDEFWEDIQVRNINFWNETGTSLLNDLMSYSTQILPGESNGDRDEYQYLKFYFNPYWDTALRKDYFEKSVNVSSIFNYYQPHKYPDYNLFNANVVNSCPDFKLQINSMQVPQDGDLKIIAGTGASKLIFGPYTTNQTDYKEISGYNTCNACSVIATTTANRWNEMICWPFKEALVEGKLVGGQQWLSLPPNAQFGPSPDLLERITYNNPYPKAADIGGEGISDITVNETSNPITLEEGPRYFDIFGTGNLLNVSSQTRLEEILSCTINDLGGINSGVIIEPQKNNDVWQVKVSYDASMADSTQWSTMDDPLLASNEGMIRGPQRQFNQFGFEPNGINGPISLFNDYQFPAGTIPPYDPSWTFWPGQINRTGFNISKWNPIDLFYLDGSRNEDLQVVPGSISTQQHNFKVRLAPFATPRKILEIAGSVGGVDFDHYELSYYNESGWHSIPVPDPNKTVINGALGYWDVTRLNGENTEYVLALTVFNASGEKAVATDRVRIGTLVAGITGGTVLSPYKRVEAIFPQDCFSDGDNEKIVTVVPVDFAEVGIDPGQSLLPVGPLVEIQPGMAFVNDAAHRPTVIFRYTAYDLTEAGIADPSLLNVYYVDENGNIGNLDNIDAQTPAVSLQVVNNQTDIVTPVYDLDDFKNAMTDTVNCYFEIKARPQHCSVLGVVNSEFVPTIIQPESPRKNRMLDITGTAKAGDIVAIYMDNDADLDEQDDATPAVLIGSIVALTGTGTRRTFILTNAELQYEGDNYIFAKDISGANDRLSTSVKVILDTAPPQILSATDSPEPVYPRLGQQSTVIARVSESALVSFDLFDERGALIKQEQVPANTTSPVTIIWDGKNSNGAWAPDGVYSYSFRAVDLVGNASLDGINAKGRIYVNVQPIEDVIAHLCDPWVISPNNDGKNDNTLISVWHTRDLSVSTDIVTNLGDIIVKGLPGTISETDSCSISTFTWDGKNNGSNAQDGNYKYQIVDGNDKLFGQGFVNVDCTAPQITDLKVLPDTVIQDINGSESVITFNLSEKASMTIDVRDISGAIVKTIRNGDSCDVGPVKAVWDLYDSGLNKVNKGIYRWCITACDMAGNTGYAERNVYIGDVPAGIVGLNVSPRDIYPQLNDQQIKIFSLSGNKAAIGFYLSTDAELDVIVRNASDQLVKTIASASACQAGYNEFTWDGKNEQGICQPEGKYIIVVRNNSKEYADSVTIKQLPGVFVYYDKNYPSSWIPDSVALRLSLDIIAKLDTFGLKGIVGNAVGLREYMSLQQDGIVIMAKDIAPDLVYSGDNSLCEQWMEDGGKIIWPGDTEFYSYGLSNGMVIAMGEEGQKQVCDIGHPYSYKPVPAESTYMKPTIYGQKVMPHLQPNYSYCPVSIATLDTFNLEIFGGDSQASELGEETLIRYSDPILMRFGNDKGYIADIHKAQIVAEETDLLSWQIAELIKNRFIEPIDQEPPVTTIDVNSISWPGFEAETNDTVFIRSGGFYFALESTDDLSGIRRAEYNTSGDTLNGWMQYSFYIWGSKNWVRMSYLTEGLSKIFYRSMDRMQNKESVKYLSVIVDKSVPKTNILVGVPEGDVIPIAFEANDMPLNGASGIDKTKYAIGANSFQDWNGIFINVEKTQVVKYKSIDRLLNEEGERTFVVTPDITPPDVQFEAGLPKEYEYAPYPISAMINVVSSKTPLTLRADDPLYNNAHSGMKAISYSIDAGNNNIILGDSVSFEIQGIDGIHEINYIAEDNVGNVTSGKEYVKLDNTPPQISGFVAYPDSFSPALGQNTTILCSFSEYVYSSMKILSGTGEEVANDSMHYLHNNYYYTWPNDFEGQILVPGTYACIITAYDKLSNVASDTIEIVVIDATTPDISINIGSPKFGALPTYISQISPIGFSVTNPSVLDSIIYRIDNESWQRYYGNFYVADEGSHLISYKGVDLLCNWGTEFNDPICFDATSPVTQLVMGLPNYIDGSKIFVNSATVLSLSADDPLSGGVKSGVNSTYYQKAAGSYVGYNGAINLTGSDGACELRYFSKDNVSNIEQEKSINLNLDNTAPTTTLMINGPSYYNSLTYISAQSNITLSANDGSGAGVSKIEYGFDPASLSTYDGSSLNFDLEGRRTLYYRSYDNLNNSESINSNEIAVDKTAPISEVMIIGQECFVSGSNFISSNSSVCITANDPLSAGLASGLSAIEYRINGGGWQGYGYPVSITGNDGKYDIDYRSIDNVGNIENYKTITVYLDNTAPITTVSLSNPQYAAYGSIYITSNTIVSVNVIDLGCGVHTSEYKLDDMSWVKYDTLVTFKIANEGRHTVSWRSIDRLGNVENEASIILNVDNTHTISQFDIGLPQYVYGSSDSTLVTSNTALTLWAYDPISAEVASGAGSVEYRVNKGPWNTISDSVATFTLSGADGPDTIDYRSADHLNNLEPARTKLLVLDNTPPTVNITSPAGLIFVNGTIKITGTASDLHFAAYCLEYGFGSSPSSWARIGTEHYSPVVGGILETWDMTSLPQGYYTIKLTSNDLVGNTAEDRVTVFVGHPEFAFEINGFNKCEGVALDRVGNIYVADRNASEQSGHNRIAKFDPFGVLLMNIFDENKSKPDGVDVDFMGNIFVTEWAGREVCKYSPEGQLLMRFGGFGQPNGIVVDKKGYIYVADQTGCSITKYDSLGAKVMTITDVRHPDGVALDSLGNIYSVEMETAHLVKYDPQGNLLARVGSYGSLPGQFDHPGDVEIDKYQNIWVVDRNNDRVQVFDPEFNLVGILGAMGHDAEQFNKPEGIALSDMLDIFVADRNNDRVQKFVMPAEDIRLSGRLLFGPSDGTDPLKIEQAINWPNPFNSTREATKIRIVVNKNASVSVKIYTLGGRMVSDIKAEIISGINELEWSGRNNLGELVNNGVYNYVVTATAGSEKATAQGKIVVMK
jgi:flagellar hook assembly protein FlgD/streptogramin lyase